jgi:hypothetical protein
MQGPTGAVFFGLAGLQRSELFAVAIESFLFVSADVFLPLGAGGLLIFHFRSPENCSYIDSVLRILGGGYKGF